MRRTIGLLVALSVVAGGCSDPPAEPPGSPTTSAAVQARDTPTSTFTVVAPPPDTMLPSDAEPDEFVVPEHPLRVEGDSFIVRETGNEFVVRGTNYFLIVPVGGGLEDRFFSPEYYVQATVEADFAKLASAGYNTVRIFLDTCSSGPDCIARAVGLNPEYLDVIADVMRLARAAGIMLLLTSNDIPDEGGYGVAANRDSSPDFAGYRNTHFLTRSGTDAAVRYWTDLMVGLRERNAAFDAVLGWSVLNEQWLFNDRPPLALESGLVTTATGTYDMSDPGEKRAMVVDGLRSFIAAVAGVVKAHHPSALVTTGFFAPQFPNETGIGGEWYVDTGPLVANSALDFYDFHFYLGEDLSIEEAAQNFGITDQNPVIMGEYGVFKGRAADPATLAWRIQEHVAESCTHGWDDWLYWGYLAAPFEICDSTWALTENEDQLLMQLSPKSWPDPCAPVLQNPNLAAGAEVTASMSLTDEPPSNAVDGTGAQWGSGSGPIQWVEIDLGAEALVTEIRLTVAQFPEGVTRHRIRWAPDDHVFVGERVIEGHTAEGDVLVETWATNEVTMRFIRIETTASPSWVSWREIEVMGVFRS